MNNFEMIMDFLVELQSIAQIGLTYTKDIFDIERYERIREISVDMLRKLSNIEIDKVKNIFANESGYQTPKLDVRGAIINNNEILLVKEKYGKWALPGGWVDVNQSVKENVIKEIKEEAGLDVTADLIIAVHDRDKHNTPIYVHKICKIFILCTKLGGEFVENIETTESGFFSLDNLPELDIAKNTYEQIKLCFEANNSENWETVFD